MRLNITIYNIFCVLGVLVLLLNNNSRPNNGTHQLTTKLAPTTTQTRTTTRSPGPTLAPNASRWGCTPQDGRRWELEREGHKPRDTLFGPGMFYFYFSFLLADIYL